MTENDFCNNFAFGVISEEATWDIISPFHPSIFGPPRYKHVIFNANFSNLI
jgi:hypothetical protein